MFPQHKSTMTDEAMSFASVSRLQPSRADNILSSGQESNKMHIEFSIFTTYFSHASSYKHLSNNYIVYFFPDCVGGVLSHPKDKHWYSCGQYCHYIRSHHRQGAQCIL